jgi:hypothetical protein
MTEACNNTPTPTPQGRQPGEHAGVGAHAAGDAEDAARHGEGVPREARRGGFGGEAQRVEAAQPRRPRVT